MARRFKVDDRVWYAGPPPEQVKELTAAGVELKDAQLVAVGSSGKAWIVTRDCVFVNWGGGFLAWVPRSHLATYREWLTMGSPAE